MPNIKALAQRLSLEPKVSLFDIDLTPFGGSVQRFTPMSQLVGAGGYTRFAVTSTNTNWFTGLLPADFSLNGKNFYVKLVVRKNAAATYYHSFQIGSIVGGGPYIYVRFRTDSLVQPAVSLANSAVGPATAVMVPTGTDHYTIVLQGLTATANFTEFSIRPIRSDTLGAFPSGATNTTISNGYLDVVSMEAWVETKTNRIESESLTPFLSMTPGASVTATAVATDQMLAPLRWRGYDYTPLPIMADGFELVAGGQAARPTLRMSNVLRAGTILSKAYGDLLGAKVTLWRTYAKYLDDGAYPDPNAYLPLDIFYIDMKSNHNKSAIEWQLASVLDQQGVMLPGRQVIRSGCQLQYRTWNGASFDYTNVSCPYVGASYFNDQNASVGSAAADKCSQQLPGCLARFPTGTVPFGGFPMVGRVTR